MKKVLLKYSLLVFAVFQCGFVHLNDKNIDNYFSTRGEVKSECAHLNQIPENKSSFANNFSSYIVKWQIGFNEFEQEEENKKYSSNKYSKPNHPFSAFLTSSVQDAYCLQYLKDYFFANKHFPSFNSLFLRFQVFRL